MLLEVRRVISWGLGAHEAGILGADNVWFLDSGAGYMNVCNLQKSIKVLHLYMCIYIICTFVCICYTLIKDL